MSVTCSSPRLFERILRSSLAAHRFVTVIGTGERGFGLLFGAVMLGNIAGSIAGSRLVTRWGIDRMIRYSTWLMLFAGLALGALAWLRVAHPAAIVIPMFLFMVALMTTMPQATAGALTPFPEISGSAASLLLFCQFMLASTAARDRLSPDCSSRWW
jgi:DHA1 family bicyclomycin/chloramphenicol resistance-like MFS transporter